MKRSCTSVVLVALGALCLSTAAAPPEDPEATAESARQLASEMLDEESWKIKFQPYVWIPASIKGDSTVSGVVADLDLDFGDVIDHFDKIFALTGRFEAWRGDYGIIFDGMFVGLESDFTAVPPIGPPQLGVNVDISQSIVDLAVAWRAIDCPVNKANPEGARLQIDLFGGGRYQYLKQKIDLSPISVGTSKDWMELMVGARATVQLNEKVAVGIRADASGFGIGSATELTWNLYAGFAFTLSPKSEIIVGYRLLDIDYSNGSGFSEFGLDMRLHGPYVAATFRF